MEDFVVVQKILASLWKTLSSFRKFWRRPGTLWRRFGNLGVAAETRESFRKFGSRCGNLGVVSDGYKKQSKQDEEPETQLEDDVDEIEESSEEQF